MEEISTYLNSGILYNSSYREYYFNLIDLNRGKVIAKIRRKYKRIPYTERERKKIREANKKPKNTSYQFRADIRRIVPKEDCFWVITSCQKGMSWENDVYSLTGEYIDRFYLNIPGTIIGIHDGYIFLKKFFPDNTTIVRKCRPE